MVLGKSQAKAKDYFRNNSRKVAKPVTKGAFDKIVHRFYYEFCPMHGFYGHPDGSDANSVKLARENFGHVIYQWQDEIIHSYLAAVFFQRSVDLNISILRQVGKTEIVSLLTAFMFEEFYNAFQMPVNIAVFAPVKTTATIMFKRTTQYFTKNIVATDGDTKEKKESVRGDQIQLFGIYDETKGSTVEGNTFDIIIRDEAHLGNDAKFNDEVEPTRFSKKAIIIRIGNGGKKMCDFYHSIKQGNQYDRRTKHRTTLVRYTYTEARPYLEQLAQMGMESARTRISNVDNYIKKHGAKNINVLKNVYCKWVLEYGNVLTQDQISKCLVPYVKWDDTCYRPLYMGLDVATLHDRTIATIMDEDRNVVDWIVVKDKDVVARAREQIEYLAEECDKRGYTEHLVGIGFDATGLGAFGVSEILEDNFYCDLVEYKFNAQKKHDWYEQAIESMTTTYEENRVKLPAAHPMLAQFMKEWTELERKELPIQKYDSFNAPRGVDSFDDFPAAFSICWNMRSQDLSNYDLASSKEKSLTEEEERHLSSVNPLARYSGLIRSPSAQDLQSRSPG